MRPFWKASQFSAIELECVRSSYSIVPALAALWLLMFAPAAAAAGDGVFAVPGRMVNVGGYALNLRCSGTGDIAVVFDAGLGDWSPAWSLVAPAIAHKTRTCTYDRAGNGLSDAGPFPRTSARIATELHLLLQRAGERPPFVLVGHSFGSFNMRLYADTYRAQVAGLALVDGSHEDQQSLEDPGDTRGFARQLASCAAAPKPSCASLYFRGLPEKTFSARLNAALERQSLAPKQARATRSELQNFDTASAAEVRAAKRSFGTMPIRILVADHHRYPGAKGDDAYWRRWEATWRKLHDHWLTLSTNASEVVAHGSSHYIQLDRPALVIRNINDVVDAVRRQTVR